MSQTSPIFDTLNYVSHLKEHNFDEQQAKGLVEAQVIAIRAQEARMNAMATKHDLELTRIQLENKIESVESRLEKRIDQTAHQITVRLFGGLTGMMAITVTIIGLMLHFMVQ